MSGSINNNFSFASGITVNSNATLETTGNGLFGWDGSQAKPISVNAGGTITADAGGDVALGVVTLNGGALAGGPSSGWGSWSFGRAAVNQLVATDNSAVTATNLAFYNGATIHVTVGKTLTISGTIDDSYNGPSSVIKIGSIGTLVLSGANAYTGNTTINAGTLELAQSFATLATNSTVTIAARSLQIFGSRVILMEICGSSGG